MCGKVLTNVGYLHEPGHEEPWIIAMDAKPTHHRVLDYGLRWGIESMFSDLKSRGFKLTDTRLKTAKRLSRLLLVLTTAMMWAVSTGWVEHSVEPVKKVSTFVAICIYCWYTNHSQGYVVPDDYSGSLALS